MGQTHTISRNNTTIVPKRDHTVVTLHQTEIVKVYPDRVELDTGGYLTATTIARMNQAANQMNLGFSVSRKGGEFSVRKIGQGDTWIKAADGRRLVLSR